MAEVLSQSQIDALLNAALSGDMELDKSSEEAQEKKYRNYDFYSPRKFTKDRIKILNGIFDSYSRLINNRINGILRTACEIEVSSIEEQRYYEFSNALTEGDLLTLARLDYKNRRDDTPILLYVSKSVMLSMLDRLIGGLGDLDDTLPSDYSFTELEIKLYETLMQDLVELIGPSWENYLDLSFSYNRVELNPTLSQPLSLDDTIVIVDLTIKFSNCEGRLSVCLPAMTLTELFSEITKRHTAPPNPEDDRSEDIFNSLRDTELEMVVELCKIQLQLSDIFHLNVGDVIDLNRPKESPIFVNIGENRWFDGKMGVHNKNIAVMIDNTYYTPKERDGEQDDE